jgi:hypothetical protein
MRGGDCVASRGPRSKITASETKRRDWQFSRQRGGPEFAERSGGVQGKISPGFHFPGVFIFAATPSAHVRQRPAASGNRFPHVLERPVTGSGSFMDVINCSDTGSDPFADMINRSVAGSDRFADVINCSVTGSDRFADVINRSVTGSDPFADMINRSVTGSDPFVDMINRLVAGSAAFRDIPERPAYRVNPPQTARNHRAAGFPSIPDGV